MRLDDYPYRESPDQKLHTAISQYKGCLLNYANRFFSDNLDNETEELLETSRKNLVDEVVETVLKDPVISNHAHEAVYETNSGVTKVAFLVSENTINNAIMQPSWSILTSIFRNRGVVVSEHPFFQCNMTWKQVDNGKRIELFKNLHDDSVSSSTIGELTEAYIRVVEGVAFEYIDRSAAKVLAFGDMK